MRTSRRRSASSSSSSSSCCLALGQPSEHYAVIPSSFRLRRRGVELLTAAPAALAGGRPLRQTRVSILFRAVLLNCLMKPNTLRATCRLCTRFLLLEKSMDSEVSRYALLLLLLLVELSACLVFSRYESSGIRRTLTALRSRIVARRQRLAPPVLYTAWSALLLLLLNNERLAIVASSRKV